MLTKETIIEATKVIDIIYSWTGHNLDELDEEKQNLVWDAYTNSPTLEDFEDKLQKLLYDFKI